MLADAFFLNDTIDATSKLGEVYIANATKSCQLTKQELNATRENGVVKANLWARTNFFSHFLSPVA